MYARTEIIAGAMAAAGSALLALPLADLPPIASVRTHSDKAAQVEMQLASVDDEQVAALLAWADVLPERSASGLVYADYIRLAVAGVLGGALVTVWTHLHGEHLVDTGRFLNLPPDGESHALPLDILRALAQRRAGVSCDA